MRGKIHLAFNSSSQQQTFQFCGVLTGQKNCEWLEHKCPTIRRRSKFKAKSVSPNLLLAAIVCCCQISCVSKTLPTLPKFGSQRIGKSFYPVIALLFGPLQDHKFSTLTLKGEKIIEPMRIFVCASGGWIHWIHLPKLKVSAALAISSQSVYF